MEKLLENFPEIREAGVATWAKNDYLDFKVVFDPAKTRDAIMMHVGENSILQAEELKWQLPNKSNH